MVKKLSTSDPEFFKKIQAMRKVKSGGKYFKNTEAAKDAQVKSVEVRLRNARERAKQEESDARGA